MESLGFEVTASDTADDFIEATKKQGVDTIKFDALEDDFPEKYSGIFCWRVFVHFTKEDALKIIKKALQQDKYCDIILLNMRIFAIFFQFLIFSAHKKFFSYILE